MPIYNFRDKITGEITEEWMSIAQRESFLKKNKNLEPYLDSAPGFSYSGAGDVDGKKTDNTWKEVLAKIGQNHPTSTLADRYGNGESIKRKKSRAVVEKHRKRQQQTP